MLFKSWGKMRKVLTPYFFGGAAASSILGIIFAVFQGSDWVSIAALCATILFLVTVLVGMYLAINKAARNNYPKKFLDTSKRFSLKTQDGVIYTYDVYKHIQAKQLFMHSYSHGFKWSGTVYPKISTDFQKIGELRKNTKDSFDYQELEFDQVLLYDDTEVVHVRMILDDTDKRASPHIYTRVDSPINLIEWLIQLGHKDVTNAPAAQIQRKRIGDHGGRSHEFEYYDSVPFDPVTKSYKYDLRKPKVGYFYQILWEK